MTDSPDSSARAGRGGPAGVLAIAVAAALGLAAWQISKGENPWGNAGFQQIQHAISVGKGLGFGREYEQFGFHPNLFLRPVYTLLLVPFTAVLQWNEPPFRLAVAGVQGLLTGLTALLASRVLERAGAVRAARFACWAIVLDPLLASQAASIVDTTVFTLLTAGAWVAGIRAAERRTPGAWALAGVVFGLAVLTRSTALAVLPAVAWRALDARPRPLTAVRWAAIWAAAAAACVVPWVLRNHALTGRWMLSTVDGVNIWMGNNENTARFLDESRSLDDLPGRDRYDSLAWFPLGEQLRSFDEAHAAARAWISEHPAEAASLAVRKAGLMWSPLVYPRSSASRLYDTKEKVSLAWTVALYAAFAAGAVVAWRRPETRRIVRDVTIVAAVFTIPHAIAWSGTRLRLPVEPFLITVAAIGAASVTGSVADRIRSRRQGA